MQSKITYLDIPKSYITKKDNKRIYYRQRPEPRDKYVYMHEEDKQYILYWCSRLVNDVVAKQVIEKFLFEDLYKSSKSLPTSGYTAKRNSIMTYTAGIVSNAMRNPEEDISHKQLNYISKIFKIIHYVYTIGPLQGELGYNHRTGERNDPPFCIQFFRA